MATSLFCLPVTIFGLSLLSISMIEILALIALLLHGIALSICETLPKLFRRLYWISCFVFLIAGIAFPVHFILNMQFSGYCDNAKRIQITASTATASHMSSHFLLYCLYYCRLYFSFRDSLCSLSKCIIIYLSFGLVTQLILVLGFPFTYLQFWALYAPLMLVLYVQTFTIINTIFHFSLLALFLIKLCKLSRSKRKTETKRAKERQKLMKHAITYTLCLCLTFISSIGQWVITWLRATIYSTSHELYMVHLTYMTFDVFISALSIYLQFRFGSNFCYKLCKCLRKQIRAESVESLSPEVTEPLSDHSDASKRNTDANKATEMMSSTTSTAVTSPSNIGLPQLNASITKYDANPSKSV